VKRLATTRALEEPSNWRDYMAVVTTPIRRKCRWWSGAMSRRCVAWARSVEGSGEVM
jgi:hypothetical protein